MVGLGDFGGFEPIARHLMTSESRSRWTAKQDASELGRNITNRWTRAEPAGLLSTTCPLRGCFPPRQLNRWVAYVIQVHEVIATGGGLHYGPFCRDRCSVQYQT